MGSGTKWRIPTDEEWEALCNDTLYDWVLTDDYLKDGSNHKGRIVTRKAGTGPCSGNSIFLPAADSRGAAGSLRSNAVPLGAAALLRGLEVI